MVYVPTDEEKENPKLVDMNKLKKEQVMRIYKFTDGSGTTMNFVPVNVSIPIFNMSYKDQAKAQINLPIQNELGIGSPQSKNQNTLDEIQIKSVCWKLKVDRLGNVKPISMSNYSTNSFGTSTVEENPPPYFDQVSIGSLEDADQKMLMHTANMSFEERLAYLQKLREISHDPNITDDEKKSNFNKIKINPPDENS